MPEEQLSWDQSELEVVSCGNCGDSDTRFVCLRADRLPVVECLCCGLAYLSPRPTSSALGRLYDRKYFIKDGAGDDTIGYADYSDGPPAKDIPAQLGLLDELRPFSGARVLDVGCATGDVLAGARKRGAEVVGLDVSQWAVETARRRYGIEVKLGTLDALGPTLGTFDVVLALEVIEHVANPRPFLRQVGELVAPGGYVMISTPNYRCARRFGERWLGFQTSFEHLYFLSDEVLSRMAAGVGLREVVWYTIGPDSRRGMAAEAH